ncbi:coiled-coil domain-containing protein 81-like isoform X2 [Cyprinus carpio]|uniref:Coiled-coil domain-containing protein 81-like isoform X2 n=1 Tax=Cyprinus carpio TaxID=7962 RepID=A0A9Q9VCY5_CYPCA|nr:coiled-coil domain-containing protein 81-like isoform X2 [Cyprinus carpio]
MMVQIAISEYERNHLSTLSRLSDDDIDHIWSRVSSFIEKQMFMRKGVYIFGLGTFTFCQQKLNLGSKHILIQRPIFILSEKLSQYYGFKQIKQLATDVPVVPLNFSALSAESPYKRDIVEGCVRETVHLLLRAASTRQSVFHTFPGIGILTFRESRVKVLFYPDFISALDSTGKLSSALTNRPETSKSSVSERLCNKPPRPATISGITIPRISAGEPLRKEPWTELSGFHQTDDDDDDLWENQQQADRATVIDLTDGLKDKRLSNTDRDGDVSWPPGGAINIMTVKRSATDVNLMCCDHRRAGQELCYVCMQRAQRNVPLYQSDERRKAEQEQERVLMLHEHQKDLLYFQKEEMDKQKKWEDSQKVAMFNLGVAEAQRNKKAAAYSQSHGSYIFAGRPCTPDRLPQQRHYMQELMQEAARRRQMQSQMQQEQQRVNKLHLLQLTEEIALKQSQQLHEKHEMAKKYRKALEAQMECRCSEISQCFDVQPVFGLMDSNPATLAEQRRRAQNIAEELINTANSRRREMLKKSLNEQKRGREIMQRDHKIMLEERIHHDEKLRLQRAMCEENWQRSADLKHQRDQEELNLRRFGGQTLTDQLGKYKRCSQCKCNTANCGKTNIFRDMNYVAGSRLML